jgi:hypothetical protein
MVNFLDRWVEVALGFLSNPAHDRSLDGSGKSIQRHFSFKAIGLSDHTCRAVPARTHGRVRAISVRHGDRSAVRQAARGDGRCAIAQPWCDPKRRPTARLFIGRLRTDADT